MYYFRIIRTLDGKLYALQKYKNIFGFIFNKKLLDLDSSEYVLNQNNDCWTSDFAFLRDIMKKEKASKGAGYEVVE